MQNPYGHDVVLKKDTYNYHVLDDHNEADAEFRKNLAKTIPDIIVHPYYIIKDTEHNDRYKYVSPAIIPINNVESKIKFVTTIIETKNLPHEVVTWIPQNKGPTIKKGDVVYEANQGILW